MDVGETFSKVYRKAGAATWQILRQEVTASMRDRTNAKRLSSKKTVHLTSNDNSSQITKTEDQRPNFVLKRCRRSLTTMSTWTHESQRNIVYNSKQNGLERDNLFLKDNEQDQQISTQAFQEDNVSPSIHEGRTLKYMRRSTRPH